jgi:hypothetical protein
MTKIASIFYNYIFPVLFGFFAARYESNFRTYEHLSMSAVLLFIIGISELYYFYSKQKREVGPRLGIALVVYCIALVFFAFVK